MSIAQPILRVLPLLAAVGLCAGSSTYSTRRAALVPEVAPPMRSGAPMETMAEVSMSLPGAGSLGDPEAAKGEEPGLELPRWQMNGQGRLRLGEYWDMGLIYENASASGAKKIAADQPDVDGGDAYGYGLGLSYTARIDERLSILFTSEFLRYSIPYVEYRTCIDCAGSFTDVTRGRTDVAVTSFGVIPSWKLGRVRLFGGLSARNQPTIERGGTETGEDDEDVSGGRANLMVSAGAEVSFGGGLRGLAMAYKTIEGSPVDFPTTFAVGLTYGFGKVKKPAPPAPVEMPPPGYLPAPAGYAPAPPPGPVATERGGAASAER